MRVIMVIAARGGDGAKSRCHAAIRDGDGLVRAMLGDLVDAARASSSVEAIHVVTPTPQIADGLPVSLVVEPVAAGPNAAFDRARLLIAAKEPDATLLFVPGDLPLVQAADIDALVAAHDPDGVTAVPAFSDGGTAALLMRAGTSFAFAFGPGSFARHLTGANICRRDAFGHDLDRPEDALLALAQGGARTRAFLAHNLKVAA